jgi:hypothetical protein
MVFTLKASASTSAPEVAAMQAEDSSRCGERKGGEATIDPDGNGLSGMEDEAGCK